jgi:hypothetical protein
MSHQELIGASSEVLLRALEELDSNLSEKGIAKLEIKIVGGFALILQGVRENGFTQDIDSMTKRFDADVSEAIAEIGKRLGIKLGWLNADMVLDDPAIIRDIVGEVTFCAFGDYRVLQVSVADLPSLLRLKIVAAGDNLEIVGDMIEYERHLQDIKGIIKALGIANSSSLESVAPIISDYPELAGKLFFSADC